MNDVVKKILYEAYGQPPGTPASDDGGYHVKHVMDNKFIDSYIETALWSSTDEDGRPLDDNYGPDDLDAECYLQMAKDCKDFMNSNWNLMTQSGLSLAKCGHDFWLTRNGHGAGFWDEGLGELGDQLTDAAKAYGTQDLYVGDDGKVYCM